MGAIIAAGVIAAGGMAYAASSAAGSAADANATNQKNAADTNALNYKMFLEGRGSNGNALLPMYFGPDAEATMGNKAMQAYLAQLSAMGSPEQQIAANRAVVDRMQPSMAAGDALVNQLFSGKLEEDQVNNLGPVLAARGDVAKAQKTGILEGLQARLNALSADRARSGYSGGGSAYQKNLLTGATIPAMQGAATVGAQADLANATDVANVRNAAIATRLNSLNLPLSQAANRIQLNMLPMTATADAYSRAMQPLDWFKMGPASFRADRPPPVNPVPGMGQIIGTAISSGASSLGNYYAAQRAAGALTPSSNPGFTTEDYFNNQRMIQESAPLQTSGGYT